MQGANRKGHDEKALADECIRQLDANHDGKVNKGRFINHFIPNSKLLISNIKI